MTIKKLAFITIEPRNSKLTAFLSLEGILSIGKDPETILEIAIFIYECIVNKMHSKILEMQKYKTLRKPIPAKLMWELADYIFKMNKMFTGIEVQLDNVYGHLIRDLGVKRKWLEKAVTFRRYLPEKDMVPESLKWEKFKEGTRRKAERLKKGLLPV